MAKKLVRRSLGFFTHIVLYTHALKSPASSLPVFKLKTLHATQTPWASAKERQVHGAENQVHPRVKSTINLLQTTFPVRQT